MVLLANRVRAKRELVKIASTSSADEKRRIRSKMEAACSLVNIVGRLSVFSMLAEESLNHRGHRGTQGKAALVPCGLSPVVLCAPCGELTSPVCRADANIPEPRRACAMPGAHDLLRLTF